MKTSYGLHRLYDQMQVVFRFIARTANYSHVQYPNLPAFVRNHTIWEPHIMTHFSTERNLLQDSLRNLFRI